MTVTPPETFRQTLLGKYDKCPKSAELYLKHDGGQETHQKTRGTVFHLFMQRATEMMLENGEPTMPGDVGRELVDGILEEDLGYVLSTEEQDAARLMAWNWCEATAFDLEAIIGTEIEMQMELGGVTVTGTIDRAEVVGSTLYLRDGKTSLHVRKSEEVQRGFQGMLYGLLALDGVRVDDGLSIGSGITDVNFAEEYPRYRTDEGPLVTKEGAWTRSELAEFRVSLERNIAAFLRSFETDEWPARDGSWCGMCPAPTECPIPPHLREVAPIESMEQAREYLSHKLSNEREGRRIQTALREFVKAQEQAIYHGDYVFEAKLSESKNVKDWDQFLLALQRTSDTGAPFEVTDHVSIRQSTKYGKRKLNAEELKAL